MKSVKAILVDDEEGVRDVVYHLLQRFCPTVDVVARCENIPQAVDAIREHQPDLVFLDIEMPRYSGFELVRFFDTVTFEIIFITAYDKYAIRAFEISAVDYLLKPVDIQRLVQAVDRANERILLKTQGDRMKVLEETLGNAEVKNIVIAEKTKQYLVAIDSIIAIEAQEAYCTIHTTEASHFVSKNLKQFEIMLEEDERFMRVHKSWLISIQFLEHYSRTKLSIKMKNGLQVKLSKYRKTAFESLIRYSKLR